MNIYVGNLSHDVTEGELRQAFEAHGQVTSATVIKDKFTGDSRGFGFVEMPSADEAKAAMEALNGQDLNGRAISANEARPRDNSRGPRSGGGGGGFGGNRGGGGSRGGFGGNDGGSRGGNRW